MDPLKLNTGLSEHSNEDYEIKWDEVLADPHFWDSVEAGEPPQKQFKVTDQMLNRYYSVAAEILEQKNWKDAGDAFLFLTFLNPGYQSFWIGFGIANQAQGEFEAAVMAYFMAEAIDPSNPVVHANAYQCYKALGEQDLAEWSYEKAIEACGDKLEYAALKSQVKQYQG